MNHDSQRHTAEFIKYFLRAYPRRSVLLVVLLMLSGLAEGVGLFTLLPVLSSALDGGGEASAIHRSLARLLQVFGLSPSLTVLLALLVAAMSAKAVFQWMAMRQVGYTVAQVATDLRLRLIRALMKARWGYFASKPIGHFGNAISNEAFRASAAFREACAAFAGLIQVAVYLIAALAISWQLTGLALLAGGLIAGILWRFVDMAHEAGSSQTQIMKSLVGRLTEALQGIKPLKAMAREDRVLPLLEAEAHSFNRAQRRAVFAFESLRSFQEPFVVFFIALGLLTYVTVSNQPFSELLILVFLFYRLLGRVNLIQAQYQDVTATESAFWSFHRLTQEAEAEQEIATGTLPPPPLSQEIRFDGVTFSYGEAPVVSGIDLVIPSGAFVALTGSSGAGKTTIADLLTALHRPQAGRILVDGIPLDTIDLRAWRGKIGYVLQEPLLFNDSIYHNVTLGDGDITREQVQEALEHAGAWEFVTNLPGGLDHGVGELGSQLSGGQRQRIALARAIVGQPALLILDEATTALDPRTEAAVCETLRRLKGTVTIVAISHQPALQDVADLVYELSGGRVTARRQAVLAG